MQRSTGQAHCLHATARRTGSHVVQSKRICRWYNVVLARPTCFRRSSGVYIYAFLCVQYLKHTQLPLAITQRTKIWVALVQRPPRTSNEYWRTTDAQQTLWKKQQFSVHGSCVDYVWLSLAVEKKLKNACTERTYSAHPTVSKRMSSEHITYMGRGKCFLTYSWLTRAMRGVTLSPC